MARLAPLIWACGAMALLTYVVAGRMLVLRMAELKAKRIHPQELATSAGLAKLDSVRVADNFRNLFEMPVLFYTVCVLGMVTGHAGSFFVGCAWAFVALRCVHSAIHCTYNKVRHRFYAFAASCAVLAAMWVSLVRSLA